MNINKKMNFSRFKNNKKEICNERILRGKSCLRMLLKNIAFLKSGFLEEGEWRKELNKR